MPRPWLLTFAGLALPFFTRTFLASVGLLTCRKNAMRTPRVPSWVFKRRWKPRRRDRTHRHLLRLDAVACGVAAGVEMHVVCGFGGRLFAEISTFDTTTLTFGVTA